MHILFIATPSNFTVKRNRKINPHAQNANQVSRRESVSASGKKRTKNA